MALIVNKEEEDSRLMAALKRVDDLENDEENKARHKRIIQSFQSRHLADS